MLRKEFIILGLCLASVAIGSDFATVVVQSKGPFGAYPYDQPTAALGEPTSWIYDDDTYFASFACSLVYGAWSTDPQNQSTVVTLGSGSSIVLGFDHRVADDTNNPFGIDFIVFGNAAFITQGVVRPDSDMETLRLTNPAAMIGEKVKVEVAQDPNGPWLAFLRGPWGDNLFPTNRFAWDNTGNAWGQPLDPLKPVNPQLQLSDFSGLTVQQAIALYDGSAGGTGYDLQWLNPIDYQTLSVDEQNGRRWIQYVRLSFMGSTSGEVDAVADVAAVNVPQFPAGDSNYDYRVDLLDLAILAENWLVCTWNCQE
ncbi:MAG: hypothetical protein ABFD91_11870 [Anaerohalosphaeraceae bacterium]